MTADTGKSRRAWRQFSEEFADQAVRLVLDGGPTVGVVARGLDLTGSASALRIWVDRARADRTGGKTGLTTTEREELTRLRKELRIAGRYAKRQPFGPTVDPKRNGPVINRAIYPYQHWSG